MHVALLASRERYDGIISNEVIEQNHMSMPICPMKTHDVRGGVDDFITLKMNFSRVHVILGIDIKQYQC